MARLIINGGQPLRGVITLAGAKNSSFKLMIAGLLAKGEVKISNLSLIDEVKQVAKIIQVLGGKVRFLPDRKVIIDGRGLNSYIIPDYFGRISRASILFLGPLLLRFGRAKVPLPGGDAIGRRPLERHWEGWKSLGVKLVKENGWITARVEKWRSGYYRFNKKSHTGTEALLLGAVLIPGITQIDNAAVEPEVDDLIDFLCQMGGKIKRINGGIRVSGVACLQPAEHVVMPDRNQAVSYALAALATKGEVVINRVRIDHLAAFLTKLQATGAGSELAKNQIRFFYRGPLQAVSIKTGPHPGFMTDWQPLWSVFMTQAQGVSRIVETVFSQRFQFVPALKSMGAKIAFFQPRPRQPEKFYNFNLKDDHLENYHGIKVTGPTRLTGGRFAVFDIRAGATLTIAGLIAQGQTILDQAELIDRGYEDFAGNLAALGAKISRKN